MLAQECLMMLPWKETIKNMAHSSFRQRRRSFLFGPSTSLSCLRICDLLCVLVLWMARQFEPKMHQTQCEGTKVSRLFWRECCFLLLCLVVRVSGCDMAGLLYSVALCRLLCLLCVPSPLLGKHRTTMWPRHPNGGERPHHFAWPLCESKSAQ